MNRARAVIAIFLCTSLALATSSASSSGNDEEIRVEALVESEAVPYIGPDQAAEIRTQRSAAFGIRKEKRLRDIATWVAQVRANEEAARIAAEQEAARRAQIEQERRAAAARAAAAPKPVQRSSGAAGGSVWDRLAQCESGGNWHINTGNGYYGGLQFNLQTWQAYGGTGYPHEHSRETQIAVAERLRAARGFQPWPACSRKLGLR